MLTNSETNFSRLVLYERKIKKNGYLQIAVVCVQFRPDARLFLERRLRFVELFCQVLFGFAELTDLGLGFLQLS
jgi:hypothetical protein